MSQAPDARYDYDNVACQSLDRDVKLTGIYSMHDGWSVVDFFSFDGSEPELPNDEDFSIILENASCVSFIDFENPWMDWSSASWGSTTVRRSHLTSNLAVCGDGPWKREDRVESVSFEISEADIALYLQDRMELTLKAAAEFGPPPVSDDTISIGCDDLKVTIFFGSSSSGEHFYTRQVEVRPIIKLEFFEPKTVEEAGNDIIACARFFAFSVGHPITPFNFKITMAGPIGPKKPWENTFLMFATVRERVPRTPEIRAHKVIWQLHREGVKEQLENSLRAWLNRRNDWEIVYELFENQLRFKPTLSAERLENAFKIIEQIAIKYPKPGAVSQVKSDKLESLIGATIDKANSLGIEVANLEKRIRDLLWQLKNSRPKEYHRLFALLQSRWPNANELSPWLFGNVDEAWREIRSKTAHGTPGFKNQSAAEKSIYAVEALAFFLIALDLDLGGDPSGSIAGSSGVRYFSDHFGILAPDDEKRYIAKYPEFWKHGG